MPTAPSKPVYILLHALMPRHTPGTNPTKGKRQSSRERVQAKQHNLGWAESGHRALEGLGTSAAGTDI